jgi:mono/diheme cytochrome c family protein
MAVVGLAVALAACGPGGTTGATPAAAPTNGTAQWLARGAALYVRECASCHGVRGEGQPNWAAPLPDGSLPAPPHDASGHTWHHSDAELTDIVTRGGVVYMPNSKMPAFGAKLSPDDIQAVLAHIKTFWGPREAAYQQDMTLQWAAMQAARRATATAALR